MGKNGASIRENGDERSHPSVRIVRPSGSASHMSATVSGLRYRWPSSVPSFTSIRQSRARSAAVEKRPAWPATPPSARARASCGSPWSRWPLKYSVGATRLRTASRGWNDGERGAEGLRERGDVEDRVERHRRGLGDEPPRAVRAVQEDLVAQPDEDDHPRHLSGRHRVVRGLVDSGEVRLGGGDRRGEREEHERDVREALRAHVTILALV